MTRLIAANMLKTRTRVIALLVATTVVLQAQSAQAYGDEHKFVKVKPAKPRLMRKALHWLAATPLRYKGGFEVHDGIGGEVQKNDALRYSDESGNRAYADSPFVNHYDKTPLHINNPIKVDGMIGAIELPRKSVVVVRNLGKFGNTLARVVGGKLLESHGLVAESLHRLTTERNLQGPELDKVVDEYMRYAAIFKPKVSDIEADIAVIQAKHPDRAGLVTSMLEEALSRAQAQAAEQPNN